MSYLGGYYVSMEQDKTELEKVLDVYSAAKQIKYIYDEKNKLIPVDRIGKIGKGVCYDHCRYQGMLAKNYGLEYRCYVFISVDSTGSYAYTGPKEDLGKHNHGMCMIHGDGRWWLCSTTGDRKQLYWCEEDELESVLAAEIRARTLMINRTDVPSAEPMRELRSSGLSISQSIAGNFAKYMERYSQSVGEEIYEVSDFTDRKYDGMTYSALTKYIQKNFTPHVFPDKVVEEYTRGKCRSFFQIMKPLG